MDTLVNLQSLVDDAKCFDTVRRLRWPEGVRLPIIISVHHQSEEACVLFADGQPDPFDYGETISLVAPLLALIDIYRNIFNPKSGFSSSKAAKETKRFCLRFLVRLRPMDSTLS